MGSNEKKAATLGMPWGTANNRLRKMILFHLLKKHNENICSRCGLLIEKIDDLSIEHLKPWEGINAKLFWDLENIAFSHLHCNVPHRYPGAQPISVPQGTKWCGVCQAPRDEKDFTPGAKGERKKCKDARNARRIRRVQSDVGIVAERHLAKV